MFTIRKNKLTHILLLIFILLLPISVSNAQSANTDGMVRLVYFLPNDRPERPERVVALRQLIKDAQEFYANEMERHRYGRKTFTIETNRRGQPVVHQIKGNFADDYYHQQTINKVWKELNNTFDTIQHIYFVAIDISSETLDGRCGGAKAYYEQRAKGLLIPASGHCFNRQIAVHELGHTFALEHDFRDDKYIMSYGANPNSISKCAAEWLNVHGFFNNSPAQINTNARIRMLAPTAAPPNGIRLRFEINNVNRPHHAMLYLKPTLTDPSRDFKLDGCHLFNRQSNTIEIVSTELVDPSQDEVTLQIIDKRGGMKRQTFPIEFVHLLPPPKEISIPDKNLAAAVRQALELGRNDRILQRTLETLSELDARKSNIKNLVGLEHATGLRRLELRENQIQDVRPLSKLKNLQTLILDDNRVSNIRPLAKLTQLTWLLVGRNPISDFVPLSNLDQLEGLGLWGNNMKKITFLTNMTKLTSLWVGDNSIDNIRPLAKLTQLKFLYLRHNRINDVTPLAELTNLQTLHLQGNQIRNVSPLAKLTKLEELRLADNPIQDTSALASLKKLKDVDIKITTPIPKTPVGIPDKNLAAAVRQALGLGAKATITKQALQKLTEFRASDHQISALTGLEHATKLTILDLGQNQITSFTTLAQLPKLRKLYLWNSEISDLSVLPPMPKLEFLDLNWNQISDVSPLAGFTNLKELWLQGNNLENTSTLFQLRGGTFPLDEEVEVKRKQDNRGRAYTLLIFRSLDLRVRIKADTTIFLSANSVPKELPTNAIVSISPSPVASPAIGEQLTLNLNITDGENVAGYQVTVQFDPTALRYLDSSNGDYLPTGAFFISPVVDTDNVKLAATALNSDNNGDGRIATVTFEVVAVKDSTVTLTNILLADSQSNTYLPQAEAGEITEPPKLKGDINADGIVNVLDLVLVSSNFGKTGENIADVNRDKIVNIVDLVLVASEMSATAAAPAAHPQTQELLTAADVRQWLLQSQRLDPTDTRAQRGILTLEKLLTVLTPKETVLLANYPNPFNPETWIPYQLAKSAEVTLTIYAVDGTVVRTLTLEHQSVGIYQDRSRAAYWDGKNEVGEPVASGVYFYTLTAGDFTATRKMLIRK